MDVAGVSTDEKMVWDVFLAAGLRGPGCCERNEAVIKLVRALGLTIFAPQERLPLDAAISSREILFRNREGIERSRAVLFVPDDAGEGVYYELGVADGLSKTVIGYSPAGLSHVGKIIDARWSTLPLDRRARTLEELRRILLQWYESAMEPDSPDKEPVL